MPIVCEGFWDHFTLTHYPSLDAVQDMFKSDAWQEANSNRRATVDQELAVVANPVKLG
jgi:uncharacterized protein (DUF1330 family)